MSYWNLSMSRLFGEEVSKAPRQMHLFKSPGPDGMSPIFFQKFWHIVCKDVTAFVLDFLNNHSFDPTFNYTHIVLIPKVKSPGLITQFRPISLCNVAYKFPSKCIANRIRSILLISSPNLNQLSFPEDSLLITS